MEIIFQKNIKMKYNKYLNKILNMENILTPGDIIYFIIIIIKSKFIIITIYITYIISTTTTYKAILLSH